MRRLLTRVRAFFKRWFGEYRPQPVEFCWRCGYACEPEGICMRCAWGYEPDPDWEWFRRMSYGD